MGAPGSWALRPALCASILPGMEIKPANARAATARWRAGRFHRWRPVCPVRRLSCLAPATAYLMRIMPCLFLSRLPCGPRALRSGTNQCGKVGASRTGGQGRTRSRLGAEPARVVQRGKDDSPPPENPESRLDGETHHAEGQDDQESPLHGRSSPPDATPEASGGGEGSPVAGAPSCDGSRRAAGPLHGLSGVGPAALDSFIPYGQDLIEPSVGDMGTPMVHLESAASRVSRAPGRTPGRPPDGRGPDVAVPLDPLPVFLDSELHVPDLHGAAAPGGPGWLPTADGVSETYALERSWATTLDP